MNGGIRGMLDAFVEAMEVEADRLWKKRADASASWDAATAVFARWVADDFEREFDAEVARRDAEASESQAYLMAEARTLGR